MACYSQSINVMHINKLKNENHMIISINVEKNLYEIRYPFMIKVFQKVGIEGTHFNIIKVVYDKPTAKIILNSEKLEAFPVQDQDKDAHSCHFYLR